MVHALEITHSLLKPDGLLVDIHPNGEQPRIEVHVGDKAQLAGHLDETDNFEEYFNADEALLEATRRGLFTVEREGLFTFLTHSSTIDELVDFLEAEWSDSVLHEETIERATELMGEPGEDREIILQETVHIGRYRAGTKPDL